MGIEPFLVASAVLLIVAQRLLRKLCEGCKKEVELTEDALISVGLSAEEVKDIKTYEAKGCEVCAGTGYKGRIALYEVLKITEKIKDLVLRGASVPEIRDAAVSEGMLTLRVSGLEKLRTGITSIDEVLKVTM